MDGTEHVLKAIQNRTSAEPDGRQNNQSNIWAGRNRIRGDASKSWTPLERDDVDAVVNGLIDDREVFDWHGLLAPATDEHLRAIVENEQLSGTPRALLIGKVNRWRQEIHEGGDER